MYKYDLRKILKAKIKDKETIDKFRNIYNTTLDCQRSIWYYFTVGNCEHMFVLMGE